jgi:hypothetical protein
VLIGSGADLRATGLDTSQTTHRSLQSVPILRDDQAIGVWRDDHLLVVARDAQTPMRCMRCNAPIEALDEVVLRWNPKRSFQGIGIKEGFARLAESQSFRLRYGRCPAHRPILSAHLTSSIFGVLTIAFLMAALCSTTVVRPGMPLVLLCCGAGASLLIALAASIWPREARVVRISPGGRAWVTGFGDAYLDALPQLSPDD